MKIAIIGAGIGGLTAGALLFRKKDMTFLFERQSNISEVGARYRNW